MTTETVKLYVEKDLVDILNALEVLEDSTSSDTQLVASLHYALALISYGTGLEEVDSMRLLTESYRSIKDRVEIGFTDDE